MEIHSYKEEDDNYSVFVLIPNFLTAEEQELYFQHLKNIDDWKSGEISGKIAKDVLDIMIETGESASQIVENKGLKQAEHDRITKMKDKLNTLRNELLQEVMLAERCKNIKLV